MRIKFEAQGVFTTYTCRHVSVMNVYPGSDAAQRGNTPGTFVELTGITGVTIERPKQGGFEVSSETRDGGDQTLHLPTDAEAAYVLDNRNNTTKTVRPAGRTEAKAEAS